MPRRAAERCRPATRGSTACSSSGSPRRGSTAARSVPRGCPIPSGGGSSTRPRPRSGAGSGPVFRCRPELAPGRALCDAVPRLARAAALRIAEGALNGRSVEALARELGVGGRQLRRAMERELGVSPVELAQTHRLLLAKCLLTDTGLPVTRVAYSSGFQSLRRFNSAFREQYRMSPSALRRTDGASARVRRATHDRRVSGRLRLDARLEPARRARRLVVPQHDLGQGGRGRGDHEPARVRRRGRLPRDSPALRLRPLRAGRAALPLRLLQPPARSLRREAALLGPVLRRRDRPAGGAGGCRTRSWIRTAGGSGDDCAMGDVEITEDDIRASRHGYYASLSYVDEKIGEVLAAFESCGLAEDAVVIFTSDHGDFLGEHGLFYKMSFREHASHVPLVVSSPGRFAARRVGEPVSLLDILPTLADLARPGLSGELAGPVDGRSLAAAARRRRRVRRRHGRRRVPGRERARTDGHDPPWALEVHPHGERSRPALPRRERPARARQPRRRARARRGRPRLPRRGRRALGSGGDRPRGPREPASATRGLPRAPAGRRRIRGTSSRPAPPRISTRGTRWTSRSATSSPAFLRPP